MLLDEHPAGERSRPETPLMGLLRKQKDLFVLENGAGGRNRTDMGWKPRGILSQDPNLRRFPIIFEYL
jgi:hypothetical protein